MHLSSDRRQPKRIPVSLAFTNEYNLDSDGDWYKMPLCGKWILNTMHCDGIQ